MEKIGARMAANRCGIGTSRVKPLLLVRSRLALSRGLIGNLAHALRVENVSLHLGFSPLSGNLLPVPQEGNAGSIADAGDDLAAGADGCVRGCNQRLMADGLAIGRDRDPGSF